MAAKTCAVVAGWMVSGQLGPPGPAAVVAGWMVSGRLGQPERAHPIRVDLDHIPGEPFPGWFHVGQRLRRAPDLQVPRMPASPGCHVVDDEPHPGAGRDIPELLGRAHPPPPMSTVSSLRTKNA